MKSKLIELPTKDLAVIAKAFLVQMNDLQTNNGYTIDQVLLGAAYTVGCAIGQRGGILHLDAPLSTAIPPLVEGYRAAKKRNTQ